MHFCWSYFLFKCLKNSPKKGGDGFDPYPFQLMNFSQMVYKIYKFSRGEP